MVNFIGPVGGIFYRPTVKKTEEDIFGEEIKFPEISSYVHKPVRVSEKPQGYQQGQYQFKKPDTSENNNSSENSNNSSEDNNNSHIAQLIIPTSGGVTNQTQSVLQGKEGFKQLEQMYTSALQSRGIDTRYAKWLAAQDALESGWGKSQGAKRHNYGNIITGSSWTGDSFVGDDHDSHNNPITQRFRAYNTIEDYIEDKLNLLQSNRYKSAFVGNIDDFIDRVYKSGYAVDPQYVQKVKSVYNNLV